MLFHDFLALTLDQLPVTSYPEFWNTLLPGFSAYNLIPFQLPEQSYHSHKINLPKTPLQNTFFYKNHQLFPSSHRIPLNSFESKYKLWFSTTSPNFSLPISYIYNLILLLKNWHTQCPKILGRISSLQTFLCNCPGLKPLSRAALICLNSMET